MDWRVSAHSSRFRRESLGYPFLFDASMGLGEQVAVQHDRASCILSVSGFLLETDQGCLLVHCSHGSEHVLVSLGLGRKPFLRFGHVPRNPPLCAWSTYSMIGWCLRQIPLHLFHRELGSNLPGGKESYSPTFVGLPLILSRRILCWVEENQPFAPVPCVLGLRPSEESFGQIPSTRRKTPYCFPLLAVLARDRRQGAM